MTVANAVLLLIVVGVLVAVAMAVVFVHALGLRFAAARRERVLDPARTMLVNAVARQRVDPVDVAELSRLSRRRQTRVFVDVGLMLAGEDRELLARLAGELGLIGRARALITSPRWWRRLEGARLLNLFDDSARDVPRLLADPHPLVRAMGAEIVGLHGAPADLELIMPLLRDDEEICRFAAKDTLMRGGRAAEDVVAAHLATDDEVTTESLLQIAVALGGHRYLDEALTRSADASARVRTLSARLLGTIGSPRATDRLTRMLGDAVPGVRCAAAESLASLEFWTAGPAIAALLDDAEWDVRRRAAVALWQLGAPGMLLLRRAVRSGSERSMHAARTTLDYALASAPVRA